MLFIYLFICSLEGILRWRAYSRNCYEEVERLKVEIALGNFKPFLMKLQIPFSFQLSKVCKGYRFMLSIKGP